MRQPAESFEDRRGQAQRRAMPVDAVHELGPGPHGAPGPVRGGTTGLTRRGGPRRPAAGAAGQGRDRLAAWIP